MRHLHSTEKASILAEGYRELDPGLAPWLNLINALPGVCTIQSCAGHRNGDLLTNGHLWLRLDPVVSTDFEKWALYLAAESGMEAVRRVYTSWGQEVIELHFQGAEHGRLNESLKTIFAYLAHIAALTAPPEAGSFTWRAPASS